MVAEKLSEFGTFLVRFRPVHVHIRYVDNEAEQMDLRIARPKLHGSANSTPIVLVLHYNNNYSFPFRLPASWFYCAYYPLCLRRCRDLF